MMKWISLQIKEKYGETPNEIVITYKRADRGARSHQMQEVIVMAREFYVAEDGSIHSHPVTVANNPGNRTNTYTPAPVATYAHVRTEYRPTPQVGTGRIVWFWIISIIVSILIAVGVTQGFGPEVYGDDGGFFATIGPFVVFIGALAGSILYGVFCAESVDYNLWAYILSALSSVGGIIATGIAVAIISFVVMVLFYILIIAVIIGVICGIAGGS